MLDTKNVSIRSASVGSMDNNVYVLTAKNSGTQVLIDAADDFPRIQALLDNGADDLYGGPAEAAVRMIITTHSHPDHVQALADAVAATGARTAAGAEDIPEIPVPTDVPLAHGDVLDFDGFDLEVISLRGHTPGSVALLYRDPDGPAHLFTGDSLFPGGLGNTQKDPQRFSSLFADVFERIFEYLPDDTVVHPGHGAGTTLGAERPHLAEWKERGW
ncbi:MBL fold metallo-hydrolase [Arthrobacter sp. Helios]|uniref:MBL fold metallo-hydrolase n=1 Tax=Arthrobacter sp. Helios TaxID=2828862 RepID=UPI00204FB0A0|nr:MBL fold metallo-hydrolase [Arthrobacter sp. Helios]UPO78218.1 MBL fold metallo-hydrolase [Arthrobacter sp. Helios]